MNTKKIVATVWRWLGHVGTAAWLWSIGGGAVSSVILRAFTSLSWPWILLLAVGTACLIFAGILTFRRARPMETRSAERTQGAVGPVGHLTLKPLRANIDVPEELVRAEWNATCQRVADSTSHPFGRGVVLSIEGTEGEEFDLRCVVTAPDGTRFESTRRIEGFRGVGSSDTRHWPGEFQPKPPEPWTPGYYAYAWIGDKPDIIDVESEVLARHFFHIDRDGIITCHRESCAGASATPGPEWRARYELRRDPKYGPGATLSIRSEGSTFGYFICKVTNPLGAVATASPRTGGILIVAVARSEMGVHYPGQFRGAIPAMPPGDYEVEWYGKTGIRPDDAQVFLARLTFNLPDGYVFR